MVGIKEGECLMCRDKGGHPEPCPNCGKKKSVEVVKRFESTAVPSRYREVDRIFSGEKLIAKMKMHEGDSSFLKYANTLQSIIENVRERGLMGDTVMVVSPSGYAKKTFAYTVMREYTAKGKYCCPIVDDVQLRTILADPSRKFLGLNYEDLLTVPLIVYMVPFNTFANLSYTRLLDLVLGRRSRDLETLIISSRPLSSITKYDKDKVLYHYLNLDGLGVNKSAYPIQLVNFDGR